MNNLALTIIIAVILMVFAIIGLGIGLIITGKSRLRRGCGLNPRDDKTNCPLCDDKKTCKENEDDNGSPTSKK